MSKILVTGSTGQLGRGIVEHLLKREPAGSVAGLARDVEKARDLSALGADIRQGNYGDKASLLRAFAGIDTLVFISTSMFSDIMVQHLNVVSAAKEAGVSRVIYTGIQTAKNSTFVMSQVTDMNRQTEQALADSGIATTLVRNPLYLDALSFMISPDVMTQGIRAPAGTARGALAARSDLAEATALIAAQTGHEGKVYTLSGSEAVSMADISAVLSEVAGHQLPYVQLDRAAFIAERVELGLPDFVAGFVAEWFEAFAAGEFAEVTGDLERLLGRKPLTTAEFLPKIFSA